MAKSGATISTKIALSTSDRAIFFYMVNSDQSSNQELFFQRFKESDVAELVSVFLSVLADVPSAVTE